MATNVSNPKAFQGNIHHDLIEDCKRGDQRAQFKVYKLYYKAMYNVSLRIVNDPMEAEDIMQESFLAAFGQITTYSGEGSFGSWLKKIVQNRSIDSWRKSRKIVFEDLESIHETSDNYFQNSLSQDEPDGRIIKIIEAIKLLSSKCRDIVSLYFLEGYDHEEISEILSITSSTSRSQLTRAKQKISRELKEI